MIVGGRGEEDWEDMGVIVFEIGGVVVLGNRSLEVGN